MNKFFIHKLSLPKKMLVDNGFVHILVKRIFHVYRVNLCTRAILRKLEYEGREVRTVSLFVNTDNQNYRISNVARCTGIHMA